METEQQVAQHYGSAGIAERVLAALREAKGPDAPVTPDDLAPLDHFHGRGVVATQELAAHAAAASPASALLDIGSGIGGPARWIAAKFDCHVTGVDLTPEFCDAAEALNAATGLGDRVRIMQRQRARSAGAGRRVRRRLFAERHHEHRRQARNSTARRSARCGRAAGWHCRMCAPGRRASPISRCRGRRPRETSFLATPGRDARRPRRRRVRDRRFPRHHARRSREAQRRTRERLDKGDMPRIAVDIIMGERAREMQRNSMRSDRGRARHRDDRGAGQEAGLARPRRRAAQRPERDDAAGIGHDRGDEGDAVAAGQIVDPPGAPRADRRADAAADRDDAEDRAELASGKQIGGLGGDRRAARPPGQPEKAGVQP